MDKEDILITLYEIISEVVDGLETPLSREVEAKDINGWDALAHIKIIVLTEKKFNIKFSLGEIAEISNVGEFVDLIEAHLRD